MNKPLGWFQGLLFLILISGIVYSQNYIETHAIKKTELLYFVPKKEHLAYTNFGFKPVIADLLWLRGISYFMYHLDKDNDYKYLFGMFEARSQSHGFDSDRYVHGRKASYQDLQNGQKRMCSQSDPRR